MERIVTESGQPRIRGTQIKFWDVYRDLAFHGMTEAEVLQKYPALEPDDLAAMPEYADRLIKARTHDEITGRPILPKDRLVHGRYYKGRCRNATIARWNADGQCFYYWRQKFDRIFIETIKYPTDEEEPWWDVLMSLKNCQIAASRFPSTTKPCSWGIGTIFTSTSPRCGATRSGHRRTVAIQTTAFRGVSRGSPGAVDSTVDVLCAGDEAFRFSLRTVTATDQVRFGCLWTPTSRSIFARS